MGPLQIHRIIPNCRKFVLAFILALTAGSTFSTPTSYETEKLALTCKVWGFLKYYHPVVAKGQIDWDKALIKTLPFIKEAKTLKELNDLGLVAINSLGKIYLTSPDKDTNGRFEKNFDLGWTDNSQFFTAEMIDLLDKIEKNRYKSNGRLMQDVWNNSTLIFGEIVDSNMLYPLEDWRLVDIFEVWNIVEYFYPYKYQLDQSWDKTLLKILPKFQNAPDTMSYHLAIREFCSSLDDAWTLTSSTYIADYFGHFQPSCKTALVESKLIITGSFDEKKCSQDDLRIGDVITAVNGVPVDTIIALNRPYGRWANEAGANNWLAYSVLFGKTDTIRITYQRGDEALEEKEIRLYDWQKMAAQAPKDTIVWGEIKWHMINDQIAFVEKQIMAPEEIRKMMRELGDAKAIIFDMRSYSWPFWQKMTPYLNRTRVPFSIDLEPDWKYPGKFIWQKPTECGRYFDNPDGCFTGEVVLLVNEKTGAHTETTCMALQTYERCTVVGSQTLASNGELSSIQFLSGVEFRMPWKGRFNADSTEFQRIGIVPDIYIEPTIDGIRKGEDEVLNAAIAYLNKKFLCTLRDD